MITINKEEITTKVKSHALTALSVLPEQHYLRNIPVAGMVYIRKLENGVSRVHETNWVRSGSFYEQNGVRSGSTYNQLDKLWTRIHDCFLPLDPLPELPNKCRAVQLNDTLWLVLRNKAVLASLQLQVLDGKWYFRAAGMTCPPGNAPGEAGSPDEILGARLGLNMDRW